MLRITLALALLTCLTQSGEAQPKYNITDIGALGISVANDINASGQVVGYSYFRNAGFHAFRTAPNSVINPATDDLGTLGGFGSTAYGINNSGQVVGQSENRLSSNAFRTAPNRAINPATDDLGVDPRGALAMAINSSGQVVGSYFFAPIRYHAFRTATEQRDQSGDRRPGHARRSK